MKMMLRPGKFDGNPFFELKEDIFFDKEYSEKDFEKDCWYVQSMLNKKMFSKVQLELIAFFWVGKLKQKDRKIKKIAKETAKYMMVLKKSGKNDKLT